MVYGIIVEYNPMHNGHIHHINKIKEKMCDNDILVAVITGYITQRGQMSIATKKTKVSWCLQSGIDIVCELPTYLGMQNADVFCYNAIKILNAMKVEKIVFGSECNDIELLRKKALEQLSDKFQKNSINKIKSGNSYAASFGNAKMPNDILGVGYIKTIIANEYSIDYESILRTNEYHSKTLQKIASATAIRESLKKKEDVTKAIPKYVADDLKYTNTDEKLFFLLKHQLNAKHKLDTLLFVREGIENRIVQKIDESSTLEELILKVKTKRYTYNHIRKVCLAIILNIQKKEYEITYIKILGYNNSGQKYINKIKKKMNIPFFENRKDPNFIDELHVAKFYDLLHDTHCYEDEKTNRPLYKENI